MSALARFCPKLQMVNQCRAVHVFPCKYIVKVTSPYFVDDQLRRFIIDDRNRQAPKSRYRLLPIIVPSLILTLWYLYLVSRGRSEEHGENTGDADSGAGGRGRGQGHRLRSNLTDIEYFFRFRSRTWQPWEVFDWNLAQVCIYDHWMVCHVWTPCFYVKITGHGQTLQSIFRFQSRPRGYKQYFHFSEKNSLTARDMLLSLYTIVIFQLRKWVFPTQFSVSKLLFITSGPECCNRERYSIEAGKVCMTTGLCVMNWRHVFYVTWQARSNVTVTNYIVLLLTNLVSILILQAICLVFRPF
jgi:hypothetical protein